MDVGEIISPVQECIHSCFCLALIIGFQSAGCALDPDNVHFGSDAQAFQQIDG